MVSIITSVYNCDKYIKDMIDSIIKQKYQEWELIIVDDASNDSTVEIIKSYKDSRIKLIENSENMGLTHNLNTALDMAKGNYVARIDGDDIAYSDRLIKQVKFMDEHQEIVLSGCWMKSFGDEKKYCQRSTDDKSLRVQLIFDPVLFHPTFIFRKEIIDKYSIKYDEDLRYAQDYKFTYDISRYGKIGNLSEILMKYRVHDAQISNDKYKEQTRCANVTREYILKDMNITLNNNQLQSWIRFCLYSDMNDDDKDTLSNIIRQIKEWNDKNSYYDKVLLNNFLQNKYEEIFGREKRTLINRKQNPDKYQELYMLLLRYINVSNKRCFYEYLKDKGYRKIALYGTSYVAKLIYDSLKGEEDIEVLYGIDSNPMSNYIDDEFKVYQKTDILSPVDAIIVTPFYSFENIEKDLRKIIDTEIISVEEILDSV